MSKSLFSLYLQKVADGDSSYVDRLCERLSDRLVFVPTANQEKISEGIGTKVNVIKVEEAHRSLIPVFSSARLLKEWCEANNKGTEFISLLGADFCSALGTGSWVMIDPGSSSSVELQPYLVQKIASLQLDEVKVDAKDFEGHEEPVAQESPADRDESSSRVEPVQPQRFEPDRASADFAPAPKAEKRSFLSFLKFGK